MTFGLPDRLPIPDVGRGFSTNASEVECDSRLMRDCTGIAIESEGAAVDLRQHRDARNEVLR
jgi:hypothetical protein